MLKVEKIKYEKGYVFKIITNEGVFSIYFGGNLDLYFNYECKGSILDAPDIKEFTLTKENYFLYMLFHNLYEDIKNCKVYDETQENELFDDFNIKNFNENIKMKEQSNSKRLFQKDRVEFHSDDYTYEETSILFIEEKEEKIIITFIKGKTDVLSATFAIRICNNGSRHYPFNVLFMNLYHELVNYEPDNHQMHLEECLYQMKLTRKNNHFELK